MDIEKIREYEKYGDIYVEKYLRQNTDELRTNWWEAFKFFLGCAFMRGRRDELSVKFRDKAFLALEDLLGDSLEKKTIKLGEIVSTQDLIKDKLRHNGVNNRGDRQVTLESLLFINDIEDHNVVHHALDRINDHRICLLYQELKYIKYIGPKLASFFIRDIVLLYNLGDKLLPEEYTVIQPVDTWVRKAAIKTGLIDESFTDERAMKKIAIGCRQVGIDPARFNAGAWYYNSQLKR